MIQRIRRASKKIHVERARYGPAQKRPGAVVSQSQNCLPQARSAIACATCGRRDGWILRSTVVGSIRKGVEQNDPCELKRIALGRLHLCLSQFLDPVLIDLFTFGGSLGRG